MKIKQERMKDLEEMGFKKSYYINTDSFVYERKNLMVAESGKIVQVQKRYKPIIFKIGIFLKLIKPFTKQEYERLLKINLKDLIKAGMVEE